MKYQSPLVTPPISWSTPEYVIPIKNLGDTLFITPIPKLDRTLKLEPADASIAKTRMPSVRLVEANKGIMDVVTEGEDLTLTVALSEVSATDIVVDLSIIHTGASLVKKEWRQSTDALHVDDNFDYITEYFVNGSAADYATTTPQITIPAGQLQASVTVGTVDDATLQRGEGSFKVGRVEIFQINDPNYMVHFDYDTSLVLLQDSSEFPQWEGSIEVWGRMGALCEYEPIIDPDTSTTVSLDFGWNIADDGVTVESFAGSTKIIDDIPLESIMLKIPSDTPPTDIDANAPVDLTNLLPNFRVQVMGGYRYIS